jgi:Bacterial protein of unknown function (DUF899)
VFHVLADAIEGTIPHRRFRDPEARLSAESGADAPRTSIAKAYEVAGRAVAAARPTPVLDDGLVYQTTTGARGVGFLMGYYGILDRTPKGRDGFQLWIRRRDAY